jgi:hypothetical protein
MDDPEGNEKNSARHPKHDKEEHLQRRHQSVRQGHYGRLASLSDEPAAVGVLGVRSYRVRVSHRPHGRRSREFAMHSGQMSAAVTAIK